MLSHLMVKVLEYMWLSKPSRYLIITVCAKNFKQSKLPLIPEDILRDLRLLTSYKVEIDLYFTIIKELRR